MYLTVTLTLTLNVGLTLTLTLTLNVGRIVTLTLQLMMVYLDVCDVSITLILPRAFFHG